ncbi:MAG: radical SAM protein [Lachnospiraceae bacterium]|nr:radical SAM protein [Lachnospiraceae bacterium]MCR5087340.1 radical SAM protein [Lachnospiraceae bacterium]
MVNNGYQPVTAVWEVTMGCNMRCGHCGSSCAGPLPGELSTEEALDLCDQIAELGLKWITLSGGEPLTRKDTPDLIKRLTANGVSVNIITNGWLLTEEMARKIKENGIATAAISIDGTPEIHDKIRKEGAFEHARRAFAAMKEQGIDTGAVTTITKQNIGILRELKEELIAMGVNSWQVQLGLPMGNLKERPDWVLEPKQVRDVIDFCYETAVEGRIRIYPADCIGYYTVKDLETRRIAYRTGTYSLWNGCNAGVRGFGILHNGDILGCTSIRNREFVEGNIRERRLRDIWEDENAFAWRRQMAKEKLSGSCRTCTYASRCLGGCPNTRLTMKGSIYAENEYCAYNLSLKEKATKYSSCDNAEALRRFAESLIPLGQYQEASFALMRARELEPDNKETYRAMGYTEFMCGNYESCLAANDKALELDGGDTYAMGGRALALYRLGKTEEGLRVMKRAVELSGGQDPNLLQDYRYMTGAV